MRREMRRGLVRKLGCSVLTWKCCKGCTAGWALRTSSVEAAELRWSRRARGAARAESDRGGGDVCPPAKLRQISPDHSPPICYFNNQSPPTQAAQQQPQFEHLPRLLSHHSQHA